jgi:hypothetical protein
VSAPVHCRGCGHAHAPGSHDNPAVPAAAGNLYDRLADLNAPATRIRVQFDDSISRAAEQWPAISAAARAAGQGLGPICRHGRHKALCADCAEPLHASVPPPHCDPRVLHAPGDCSVCDEQPALQRAREVAGVNFTGGTDPSKAPCPSDLARGPGVAERWRGNAPKPAPEAPAQRCGTDTGPVPPRDPLAEPCAPHDRARCPVCLSFAAASVLLAAGAALARRAIWSAADAVGRFFEVWPADGGGGR